MKIGSHVNMCAPHYLLGAIKETIDYQGNTFMFYTGAPQNSFRTPIEKLKVAEFKEELKRQNIQIEDLVVHAPYLINLGNCEDEEKYQVSLRLLETELNRCSAIGCQYLVLHPGNALKASKEDAISRIAYGINQVSGKYPTVKILLETMAGKGSEVGSKFEEIRAIIDKITNKDLIGVCLDTCHIHDGGYILNDVDALLQQFDQIIGLNYLYVIHVNDSKNICNSHKDRHANFGYGEIGFSNLIRFIYHPLLENKIFILETPWISYDKKEVYPPYRFEIEMIRKQVMNENLFSDVYAYYQKESIK